MAEATYRVYISSTHEDLHDYRDAVSESVVKMGMLPITRDELGRAGEMDVDFLESQIGKAQVFIGVYAHKYSDGILSGISSLIEREYEIALKLDLHCLFFVIDPDAPWRATLIDRGDQAHKLDSFKARIARESVYGTFCDVHELQIKVLNGLHQMVDLMHSESGTMTIRSIFGTPLKGEQFKSDIFMIMPFAEKFTSVYSEHIKPTVTGLNLHIIRGDDFFSENAIVNEIWAAIYHCRLVIAECTDRNPNVYYELGLAHAVGKPSILLVQDINDIPFDLRHLRIIVYEPTSEGLKALQGQLSKAIEWLLMGIGH